MRKQVEAHAFVYDTANLKVTVSIGVASVGEGMKQPVELVGAADDALYQAKRQGRNRVVRAG
jgi:diguanylate cyclase (GGDEF)-like protein